jgi:hypothetical protein
MGPQPALPGGPTSATPAPRETHHEPDADAVKTS